MQLQSATQNRFNKESILLCSMPSPYLYKHFISFHFYLRMGLLLSRTCLFAETRLRKFHQQIQDVQRFCQ